jgi:hypothetical protein
MTSRLLNAEAHSRSSACAQALSKKRAKMRSVSAPITKPAQLEDGTSMRLRSSLQNKFVKTASSLAPAPEVDSSAFPQEDMMLGMRRENATRTKSKSSIQLTTDNPDRFCGLVGEMMENPQLNAALGVWAQQNGWLQQSTGVPSMNNTRPSLSDFGGSDSSSLDPASSPEALPNNMSLLISEEELED